MNGDGQLARVRDGLVLNPEAGTVAKLVDMTRSATGNDLGCPGWPGIGVGTAANCVYSAI